VPALTALFHILGRGRGMAERQQAAHQRVRSQADAYIKELTGTSPADEIAAANALLDAGTINQEQFAKLKAKALA